MKVVLNGSLWEGKEQTQIVPQDQVLGGQWMGCSQERQMEKCPWRGKKRDKRAV